MTDDAGQQLAAASALDRLTFGELEWIEKKAGQRLAKISDDRMRMRTMRYVATVLRRRTDPTFSETAAELMTLPEALELIAAEEAEASTVDPPQPEFGPTSSPPPVSPLTSRPARYAT